MSRTPSLSRRGFVSLAALAAAAPALASCSASGGSSSGSASGGGTTVTLMIGAQDFTKEMIADFQKSNPGIKIQIIENDATRLNTMLASGNAPDIVAGPAVGSANNNARGLATDLTPYLKESGVLKEDDLATINDAFRWDGTRSGSGPLYGLVKDWSGDAALWYNTELFDAAGIDYLSETEAISYDELLELAKKLTKTDGDTTSVYGLGVEWEWTIYSPISAMVVQQGGSLFNDDLTVIDFSSPEALKAIQWYVDFGNAGVGPTSLSPLADGADFSTFSAGRMAITQDGYWFGGNFAADDAMQTVKMAPAPTMGSTRVNPSYGGQGWWIPEAAKNKDAAWKVMEYYMAGKPAQDRAASGWGLPSVSSLMDKLPQERDWQASAYTTTQNEIQYAQILPDTPYATTTAINTSLDTYIQAAIKDEMTVEEAAKAATDEVNKTLAQGKDQIGDGK